MHKNHDHAILLHACIFDKNTFYRFERRAKKIKPKSNKQSVVVNWVLYERQGLPLRLI